MELATGCLPLGALPYPNVKLTTAMMAKLFSEFPFIPILPNLSPADTIENRLFENIPGVAYKDGKLTVNVNVPEYEEKVKDFSKAYNKPTLQRLEPYGFNAEFMEKFQQMVKKFKSPNVYINMLGPFTVSQMILSGVQEQVLGDKSYRKLFIQAVCVKSLWVIEKIKKISPKTVPVVMLEEPMLNRLGMLKRQDENITSELVINMISKVVEKLKHSGAIVGVQCMEKCDWSVPIKAGVDIISFDAYNNPNNLGIIPDILTEYLRKGGMINWGIVPVLSDSMVQGLTVDYLYKRLSSTIGGIVLSGVPAELLYLKPLVSLNGDTDKLSVFFAEKAIIMAINLSKRLTSKS